MKFILLAALVAMTVYAEDEKQLLKEFSVGNTAFSANVYTELLKTNTGNFLVCPLSVDVILALVHEGAKGNTAKQLSTGLHLPESSEKIQEIFKTLGEKLKGNDKYSLDSANKVYIKDGVKISDDFKNTAVNVFHSEIQNIDFAKSVAAANEMNKWVEEKTHDKIKNLIDSKDLDDDTRAVLINAMYFKAPWHKQFSEYATKVKPFYLNNKNTIDVNMMEMTDQFKYYECDKLNAKFLEVPYKGHEVTMTFVLPNDKEGLSALESKISHVLTVPEYKHERVHVQIPKFKIETTIQFKPILEAMGIEDAFSPKADLTGITANHDNLFISKVVQKAFIEIDENGTTAAAATAVIAAMKSSIIISRDVKLFTFHADHPFIFILRNHYDVILFVGKYNNPL